MASINNVTNELVSSALLTYPQSHSSQTHFSPFSFKSFSVSAVYSLGAAILLLLRSSKPKKHTPKFSRPQTSVHELMQSSSRMLLSKFVTFHTVNYL